MDAAWDQLVLLAPALAFLLAAVPLAHLLGDLGVFDALARRLAHRVHGTWAWWLLATVTTVVLNLDTTVVLLTPLYVQVARRRQEDPLVLGVVPFLLANLASSVLPVSNLTNLIAAERFDLTAADLVRGLGPATLAMVATGFVAHHRWAARRRPSAVAPVGASARHPEPVPAPAEEPMPDAPVDDTRALLVGGAVVAGLLAAFLFGPMLGVVPWEAVVVADVILAVVLRRLPWRQVPVGTAAAIAALGVVAGLVVPGDRLGALAGHGGALGAVLGAGTAAALAAAVDNLPALLAFLQGIDREALLPVLLGVNAGAVLTPIGSLANLLWLRTARAHGLRVRAVDLARVGVGVGGPAFVAGVAVLAVQRALVA